MMVLMITLMGFVFCPGYAGRLQRELLTTTFGNTGTGDPRVTFC